MCAEAARVTLHHHEHDLSARWEFIQPTAEFAGRHLFRIPEIKRGVVRIRARLITVPPTTAASFSLTTVPGNVNDHAIACFHFSCQIRKVLLDQLQVRRACEVRHLVVAINEVGGFRIAQQLSQHAPRRRAILLELRIPILQVAVWVFAIGEPHVVRGMIRPLRGQHRLLKNHISFE